VGGLAGFYAVGIGRVISNERVRYGKLFFSTVFDTRNYESYYYVA